MTMRGRPTLSSLARVAKQRNIIVDEASSVLHAAQTSILHAAHKTTDTTMNQIESEEHFKSTVAQDKFTVASFSAGWCGSCKIVKPHVEKLAEEFADKATFVKLANEDFEDLFEELDVDSFPHFRVYKNNELLGEYTGSKLEKIENFIRTKLE